MHDVVAMTWTACTGGNDAEIIAAYYNLRIARPSVVLRLPRSAVVSGWNECPVDDPQVPRLARDTRIGKSSSGELRGDRCNDAMDGGFRDPKHDCELAKGQIRPQSHTRDQDASPKAQ